jgi:hypothetical protein
MEWMRLPKPSINPTARIPFQACEPTRLTLKGLAILGELIDETMVTLSFGADTLAIILLGCFSVSLAPWRMG